MTRRPDLLHPQGAPMHRLLRPLPSLLLCAVVAACAGDASTPAEVPAEPATLEVRGGPPALPSLAISPASGNFTPTTALRPGRSVSVTFTVTNSGSRTDPLIASVAGSGFVKGTDSCAGTRLGRRKSCSVTVTFAPTEAGSYFGNLSVFAGIAEVNAALSGNAAWSVYDVDALFELISGQWFATCAFFAEGAEPLAGMPVSLRVSGGPSEPFTGSGNTDASGLLRVAFPSEALEGSYTFECTHPEGSGSLSRTLTF